MAGKFRFLTRQIKALKSYCEVWILVHFTCNLVFGLFLSKAKAALLLLIRLKQAARKTLASQKHRSQKKWPVLVRVGTLCPGLSSDI